MRAWARQFAVFFYIGFIALLAALANSLVTDGILFAAHSFVAALRAFGVGFIAAGMALWVALRRDEAGKGGLNPLFGFLISVGAVLLIIGLLFPHSALGPPASLVGLGFMLAALAIGLLAMLIAPARPAPAAKRWPEEAQTVLTRFAVEVEEDHADEPPGNQTPAEPDDLTAIEGIGPRIQAILNTSGITTFDKLASSSPDEIRRILKAADLRAPADPSSWPRQAELAARGEWEALRSLQEELVAGRAKQ